MGVSQVDIERDLDLAQAAHARLVADLDRLVAADELVVATPSRLPNWTRGHVLTHITNSGRGHVLMLTEAAAGRIGMQYPLGVEGRRADIERGASRPAADQVDDLRRSIEELEAAWAASDWAGHGITPTGGQVAMADLPFFRIRETAVHHVDLDIGVEFADLDPTYVRLELRRMEMLWRARQPMGMPGVPATALALDPPDRLAWFMGRLEVPDLAPANVF